MARTADPIETSATFLAQAERSPLTIQNCRGDLAAWFDQVNGEAMAPAKVTPTDLRQSIAGWLSSDGSSPAASTASSPRSRAS